MNLQKFYPLLPLRTVAFLDRYLPMSEMGAYLYKQIITKPSSVKIHITCRCNYECIYCYSRKDILDLDIDSFRQIIDLLAAEGVGTVELTGGEPLMHEDILKMIAYLKKKRMNCTIYTNGSLLTDPMLRSFREYGRGIIVSVKYESKEQYVKYTRSRGHPLVEKNILRLTSTGIKTLGFITLSGPANPLLRKTLDRILHLGAYPVIERYVPVKGPRIDRKLEVSPQQWADAMSMIREVYASYMPVIHLISRVQRSICSCHTAQISIMQNGDVLPCQFAPRELAIGNLWKEGLLTVLHRTASNYDTVCLPEGCRGCKHISICNGGCRTHTYLRYGAMSERDPLCLKTGDSTLGHAAFALLHIYDSLQLARP